MSPFFKFGAKLIDPLRQRLSCPDVLIHWAGARLPVWPRMVGVASRSVLMASVVITVGYQGLQHWSLLEPLELAIFDRFVQAEPDAPLDARLLIVTITEADLQRYGWPLKDQQLAEALRRLQRHDPTVIGLDLYRDLFHPPGTAALTTQLQAPNLIAITDNSNGIPAPAVVSPERVGFNDLVLDPDGVVRRNLLFVAGSDRDYYSFALRVGLGAIAPPAIQVTPEALQINDVRLPRLSATSGGYQQIDHRGYQILLDYASRQPIAPTITLTTLLTTDVDPHLIRDRIVLIGSVAPSLKDARFTPYRSGSGKVQMSGGMIHGQMVRQVLDLLAGRVSPWRGSSPLGEWIGLWAWVVFGGAIAWYLRHPAVLAGVGGLGTVLIIGVGWVCWGQGVWIPVAEPIAGFWTALLVAMAHRLFYTTNHEPVTGLLNESAFLRQLEARLRHSAPVGVLWMALDHWILISRSLDTHHSDRLLQRIESTLRTHLPRTAQIARISEGEFAIALSLADPVALTATAETLQTHLPPSLAASIGITVPNAQQTHRPADLLRDAHTAMYRAQAKGSNSYAVFSAGMQAETVQRFNLEADLRRAIAAKEFTLYYQPIVDLATDRIAGFEALVRWIHPQRGFIAPGAFIPLAEETGLIVPLGDWIGQTAIAQIQAWTRTFPHAGLIMSINLSSRQFDQGDVVERLAQWIAAAELPGHCLKLEITESMVMGNVDVAIDLMLRFKALGCRLSLDDFGTGYSSLSQLRRFPLDTLKVDQSFVRHMADSAEDDAIVRMIIDLGHTLGMDIIAEGIETPEDAERLRSLHCDFGQGYLWSKPLPAAAATDLLSQQPNPPTASP
jgi:diguanylate cyclase (GGDEF)-like protein